MNRKTELTAEQMEQLQELLGMEIDPEDELAWTDGKTINETLFAEQFLKKYQLDYLISQL